jgi:DNA-binding beta-propeller fold protein YncE
MIEAALRVVLRDAVAVAVGVVLAPVPVHAAVCGGDCDGDGVVAVEEVVRGIGMALGDRATCAGFDSGAVSIAALVRAVNNALNGCGPIGPYDGRAPALSFVRLVRESPKVLDQVSAVAVSPDGAHVYAANAAGTLTIFVRTPDGRLAFAGSVAGGPQDTESMTISADGRHLYVGGRGDLSNDGGAGAAGRLAVFTRDSTTGGLQRVQLLAGGSDGLAHFGEMRSLAISPDGGSVYVAEGDSFSAPTRIRTFARDRNSGRVSLVDSIAAADIGLGDIRAIVVSADSTHAFVAGEIDNPMQYSAQLLDFSRDPATGRLSKPTLLDRPEPSLTLVGAIAAQPDGSLLVAGGTVEAGNPVVGALIRFARTSPDAELTAGKAAFDGGGLIATGLAVSADGSRAYTVHDDALSAFSIDTTTGALRSLAVAREGEQGVAGLSWADAVAVSPDGAFIYTGSALDSAVVTFARTAEGLAFLDVRRGSLGGVEGIAGVKTLAISPAGDTLYATGNEHTLAAFATDKGGLSPLDVLHSGEAGLPSIDGINESSIAVSPDGANLYATVIFTESVLTFARDRATGRLAFASAFDDIERNGPFAEEFPFGLTVSPDGADVYVTGTDDSDGRGITAAFRRASADGTLTWAGGLREAGGTIITSPDGANLYAIRGALFALARDPVNGRLTPLASYPRPAGSAALAISPDGQHVYVADARDALIGVYARAGGGLVYLGDDAAQVPRITALAVSPDGTAVYATSAADDSLTVLGRRRDSGRLRWNERHRDGSGADGLAGAAALVVSPDSEWVYVAGSSDSAIAIFRVDQSPILHDGAACEFDEDCASGVCDFLLRRPDEGGSGGPIFPRVCCQRLCTLEEACDSSGLCQPRFAAP